ncbi:apolipo protein A-I binding protein-like protein [Aureobasidium pullulans]|nr:apolipo protein A-I binding protein-like protein [Aureobasidium pullulans]
MALRTLGPKAAAALDQELMSTGAFSLDQLMELAGLSVSQALFKLQPPQNGNRILIVVGPGNNGGDGLVAARHLWHYGYKPTVYYPKQPKNELYQRLSQQLRDLRIPFTEDFSSQLSTTDFIIDSIFGFSFSGEVREPFPSVITALRDSKIPVLAVDAPSSWNIETGPPDEGPGKGYNPDALISLTAPKPLVKWFEGRHFVGGRFLTQAMAEKYELDIPPYEGLDQVVEVPANK